MPRARSYRLSYFERELLLSFCDKHCVTQSFALRFLVYFGPIAVSANDVIPGNLNKLSAKEYSIGSRRRIQLELVRQTTNLQQCTDAFEHYVRRNRIDHPGDFAPTRYLELPDEIQSHLYLVASTIDRIDEYVQTLSKNSFTYRVKAAGSDNSKSVTEFVVTRFEDEFLDMLSLKSESFRLSGGSYIRSVIPLLGDLWEYMLSNARERVELSEIPLVYVSVVDFEDLYEDFNTCGKVFNDAAHYSNATLRNFRTNSYELHINEMEVFLGKLNIALGYYNKFLHKYNLSPIERGE